VYFQSRIFFVATAWGSASSPWPHSAGDFIKLAAQKELPKLTKPPSPGVLAVLAVRFGAAELFFRDAAECRKWNFTSYLSFAGQTWNVMPLIIERVLRCFFITVWHTQRKPLLFSPRRSYQVAP